MKINKLYNEVHLNDGEIKIQETDFQSGSSKTLNVRRYVGNGLCPQCGWSMGDL